MKNKKANIPVTILVVLTIVICIVALIAFHTIRENEKVSVAKFAYIRALYNFQEMYYFQDIDKDLINSIYPDGRSYSGYFIESESTLDKTVRFFTKKKTEIYLKSDKNYLIIDKPNDILIKIPVR